MVEDTKAGTYDAFGILDIDSASDEVRGGGEGDLVINSLKNASWSLKAIGEGSGEGDPFDDFGLETRLSDPTKCVG